MIMKLNTYRLSSLEDPTDEQLHALMEQSSRKAKRELERRMQEVREKLKAYRAKNVSDISM